MSRYIFKKLIQGGCKCVSSYTVYSQLHDVRLAFFGLEVS